MEMITLYIKNEEQDNHQALIELVSCVEKWYPELTDSLVRC